MLGGGTLRRKTQYLLTMKMTDFGYENTLYQGPVNHSAVPYNQVDLKFNMSAAFPGLNDAIGIRVENNGSTNVGMSGSCESIEVTSGDTVVFSSSSNLMVSAPPLVP